ncbi:MAG: hypothetical protein ABEJ72_01350 [Candidatus Aenigmatarchaeota archaeon]
MSRQLSGNPEDCFPPEVPYVGSDEIKEETKGTEMYESPDNEFYDQFHMDSI